tara:strand:- start:9 stop:158 length:150 start_codon:yes stop_codon:yes gene_type:complete
MTELETLAEMIKIYEDLISQELKINGVANPAIYYVKNHLEKKMNGILSN